MSDDVDDDVALERLPPGFVLRDRENARAWYWSTLAVDVRRER